MSKIPKHGDTVECDEEEGVPCPWCAGFQAGYQLGKEDERERVEGLVEDVLTSIQCGEDGDGC